MGNYTIKIRTSWGCAGPRGGVVIIKLKAKLSSTGTRPELKLSLATFPRFNNT